MLQTGLSKSILDKFFPKFQEFLCCGHIPFRDLGFQYISSSKLDLSSKSFLFLTAVARTFSFENFPTHEFSGWKPPIFFYIQLKWSRIHIHIVAYLHIFLRRSSYSPKAHFTGSRKILFIVNVSLYLEYPIGTVVLLMLA